MESTVECYRSYETYDIHPPREKKKKETKRNRNREGGILARIPITDQRNDRR